MLSSVYLVEYTLHQNLMTEIHTQNFDFHITVPSPNLAFLCRNLDCKPYSIIIYTYWTVVLSYNCALYCNYRSLFQQAIVIPTSHIDKQETFNDQVFNQKPGLGLQRSQFFATPFMSNGSSATCGGSLFGGLVHSNAGSLDVKLELPQLTNPEDTNWVINNTISSLNSKVTSDEGFTELSSEATETGESAAHSVGE